MITLLKKDKSIAIHKGKFNINLVYPGIELNKPGDAKGLLQLGRFDVAHLLPGVFVGMHLHRNDEILSYLRQGEMTHEDSHGKKEVLSNTYMMMMNAGNGFHHQEEIPEEGKDVRMLQIFLRPQNEDEAPLVSFARFDKMYSENEWRLIAGYQYDAPLLIRSKASVWDTRLNNSTITLPNQQDKTYLVFVFTGSVTISNGNRLSENDSLIYRKETLEVSSENISDLVLFELDEKEKYVRSGMFSA